MPLEILYVGIALLTALQIADLWTTWRILKSGGTERNPAARFLFDKIGWTGVVALKLLVTGGASAFTLAFPAFWPVLALAIMLMVWTVGGNLEGMGNAASR